MAVTFTKEHHLPHESRLAAYNAATSEIVWQQDFSEITGAIACNPATNVIYVPSDTGLSAFDAVTGLEIWYYTGEGAVYTPSVANGVVYAISETAQCWRWMNAAARNSFPSRWEHPAA
ncbi:MAG: PQQ-binding-like beta-propeller repeat protein [bacterium]|nr:PQQ-binding-like beta-propeller repeat protein [bacterium]